MMRSKHWSHSAGKSRKVEEVGRAWEVKDLTVAAAPLTHVCPETHWHSGSIDLSPAAVYTIKISASTLSTKCFWPLPSIVRPFSLWGAVIRGVFTLSPVESLKSDKHTVMWVRGKQESALPLTLMTSINPVDKCISDYGQANHTSRPCLRRNVPTLIQLETMKSKIDIDGDVGLVLREP